MADWGFNLGNMNDTRYHNQKKIRTNPLHPFNPCSIFGQFPNI